MAPVSVEQMARQALTRVDDITNEYPSTRAPMYRRIGVTQRQLFVRAAQVNPDYYGANASVVLAAGGCNLATLPDMPELLQRVEILDPGSSGYLAGREVSIVSLTDPAGELAPRAMLRQLQLQQVDTDLALVTSLRLWYSHIPLPMAATENGATLLALDQPWDTILEVDLAGWLVSKATALADKVRGAAMAMFTSEKVELEKEFETHLRTIAPTVQRFLSPLARPSGVI